MRTNVIYLSDDVAKDKYMYIKGKILADYPINEYKVWFVDKNIAEEEQTKLLTKSKTILVKKASA